MTSKLTILAYFLSSAHTLTYYVTIYNYIQNQSCIYNDEKLHPCISLDELADSYFNSSNTTTFYFVPGDFVIRKNFRLNFASKKVEILAWKSNPIDIDCFGNASISFKVKGNIRMESIRLHNCTNSDPLIDAQNIAIDDVHFNNSINTSIMVSTLGVHRLSISNCIFQTHVSHKAIHIKAIINVPLYIINSTFVNNLAGAIELKDVDTVIIQNCKFINNSEGGIVATSKIFSSFITIKSSVFLSNRNNKGGALSMIDYTKIHIINTVFDRNMANESGGAVCILSEKNEISMEVEIDDSTFQFNSASSGGGMYSATLISCKISFYLEASKFLNNSARNGGALYISRYKSIQSMLWVNTFQNCLSSTSSVLPDSDSRLPNIANSNSFLDNLKLKQISFTISGTIFKFNSGFSGGGIYAENMEKMVIRHCYFEFNFVRIAENDTASITDGFEYEHKGGAVLLLPTDSSILIDNCRFHNSFANDGGALFYKTKDGSNRYNMTIINTNFNDNVALKSGGAISTVNTNTTLRHCTFTNNQAHMGGALQCYNAHINSTDLILQDNKANDSGGGMYIKNCPLILKGESYLIGNIAKKRGGAIFSHDQAKDCNANSCVVEWTKDSIIDYVNNSAPNGSVLYGGMLDRCQYGKIKIKHFQINHLLSQNRDFTSDVTQLCFCDNDLSCCDTRYINRTIYPGQRFAVPIACLDHVGRALECDLHISYIGTTKIHLGEGESSITLYGHQNLTFHAFTREKKFGTLALTSTILCDLEIRSTLKVNISIREGCPLGFNKKNGRCKCDPRLIKKFPNIKCYIDNIVITTDDIGWLGYNQDYLITHERLCPLNYCFSNKTLCPTCPSICQNNHDGILCGGCLKEYSIVLGSNECKKCTPSQKYNIVWLTLVITVAGVMLVIFLLVIKMTVSSGTTNGLIFYANIISFSGLLDMMTACSSYSKALRVFMAWINLDLGVEVCFYSGMGVYEKTWLQFAFPLYVWFLVAVIIVVCHYSSSVMKVMGRRNIEVLATLFLLSYAKLLKTMGTALSFTAIEKSNARNISDIFVSQRVWTYDGNIEYLSKLHVPLFVVALLFFFLLFLPYTLLLLFGQCIGHLSSRRGLRCLHSNAVSAILDSYHAPYSTHHRYWTGLGLVVRCCLFAIFGTSYDLYKNQFWISIIIVSMLTVKLCICSKVYRSKFVDLLEIFYLVNLGVLSISLQFKQKYCHYLTISTTLSMTVFLLLLSYHVIILMKDNFQFYTKIKKALYAKLRRKTNKVLSAETPNPANQNPSTTLVELRESLLDN